MASEMKVLRAADAEDHARAPLLCDGERDSELDCLSTTAATADGSKQTPGDGSGADGEALSSSRANAHTELEGPSPPPWQTSCMGPVHLDRRVTFFLGSAVF